MLQSLCCWTPGVYGRTDTPRHTLQSTPAPAQRGEKTGLKQVQEHWERYSRGQWCLCPRQVWKNRDDKFANIDVQCWSFCNVRLKKQPNSHHHIESSRPEWCISSMIYGGDTPFWSETLNMHHFTDPKVSHMGSKTDAWFCTHYIFFEIG